MRTIKKYPNRRLYDMEESRYITLADVQRMVRDRIEFQVQDARTGEDITRSILLQVMLEEEDGAQPLLTTETLTQLIRFYGDTLQGMAAEFLQGSLDLLSDQRKLFETQLASAVAGTPFGAWSELTGRQLELWRSVQEAWLGLGGLPADPGTGPGAARDEKRGEAAAPEPGWPAPAGRRGAPRASRSPAERKRETTGRSRAAAPRPSRPAGKPRSSKAAGKPRPRGDQGS